jgi:hypothetical protein
MKPTIHRREPNTALMGTSEEILILTDGRILAHNLTPAMAAVLLELNPNDERMRQRAMVMDEESNGPHEFRAGS